MNMLKNGLLYLLVIMTLTSCFNKGQEQKKKIEQQQKWKGQTFLPQVKYAKGFSIEMNNGYKEIKVYNPWKNDEVLRKYILMPRGSSIKNKEVNVTYIQTPVKTVAIFSNTHVGSLVELGLVDKIVGMTRANQIFNSALSQKVKDGKIPNIGGAHNKNLDIETIVELNPELIILSAFNDVKAGESHLDEIGFNMAYALNWMEDTPLGRAEWIKFVAAFFEKDQVAEGFFNQVQAKYLAMKQKAAHVQKKSSVMMGWAYRGTWYMPGGRNYMVNYLRDAGADYFLLSDSTRGNIPMSVESVLDQCNDADVWIYPGICKELKNIENAGDIFTQFKSYRKKEVYNIYKRTNAYGGSDWWETATIRPDLVLKDFIKILHPEILPKDSTYFMSKLQ